VKPTSKHVSLLVLVALAGGCAKGAARSEAPMAPGSADAAAYGGDGAMAEDAAPGLEHHYASDFDGLQAEFERLDADLSSEGIFGVGQTTASETPAKTSVKTGDAGRCERISELKTAICDVAERICGLAEDHEDEPKYAEACTRAGDRCEQATEASDSCE
jgi:hypothetical protein